MKDVLYHAKVGTFENKHELKPLNDTHLKQSLIGINPNWITKPKMGPIFSEIVNQARSCRAFGSAALEIISVVGHWLHILHAIAMGFCRRFDYFK